MYVCMCWMCVYKKTEIEFALFKQNASFWTVFVLLLFLFCFILSYCFFWSQDSSLPQVQDSESGLKKCLQKASKLSLRIFLTLIFNHCPRRTSTCGGTLVKRFFLFFTFFDFLQYFNTFLLGFRVFLLHLLQASLTLLHAFASSSSFPTSCLLLRIN